MSRSSRKDKDKDNETRHRLRNKHGLNVSRNSALPEDEGLDDRARRGLLNENGKTYGVHHAPIAISYRVNGNLAGRKDER